MWVDSIPKTYDNTSILAVKCKTVSGFSQFMQKHNQHPESQTFKGLDELNMCMNLKYEFYIIFWALKAGLEDFLMAKCKLTLQNYFESGTGTSLGWVADKLLLFQWCRRKNRLLACGRSSPETMETTRLSFSSHLRHMFNGAEHFESQIVYVTFRITNVYGLVVHWTESIVELALFCR